MAKTKSLSFNDRYESSVISDDPMRIIRLNPADPEIISRVLDVQRYFKGYKSPAEIGPNPDGSPEGDSEKSKTYIGEFTAEIRRAFNGIFLSDVYNTIFAGQSPLCVIGQKHLYEEVLGSLFALMESAVKTYNKKGREKVNKYLKDTK